MNDELLKAEAKRRFALCWPLEVLWPGGEWEPLTDDELIRVVFSDQEQAIHLASLSGIELTNARGHVCHVRYR